MIIPDTNIKEFLEERVEKYNHPRFIESDPICIPHKYRQKEDIEISGFLTSVIAWGNRRMIIRNAVCMMEIMGNSPYDFVMNHNIFQLERFNGFVHRTFNGTDAKYFITALKNLYVNHEGPEKIFSRYSTEYSTQPAIHEFRRIFFSSGHPPRTTRHLPDPLKKSAAKRINMFLRWMVRRDSRGVDFGLWRSISPSVLSCPLDVHTGNTARKLGLIRRKQNDSIAVSELDSILRKFDNNDPVKYDFALFGLGAIEKM